MTRETTDDSAELRKARGAFFTPATVTEFIARWAIREASDEVLEPSCGDGAFIEAAARRLRQVGGDRPIRAHELHEASAKDARRLLAELGQPGEVHVGDFLATTAKPTADAVIGNPPYVRYQGFTGEARAAGLAAARAQGVTLSNLSSSWAPFVIHSAAFLRPHGRLGLVLPAELLSSNYAREVRDYLLARFSSLRIVLVDRQVFPGVQTEALLLLAEGTGGTGEVRFASITDAASLGTTQFDVVMQVAPGQRWTTALVPGGAMGLLSSLAERGLFVPLSRWGRLSLGAVTGRNRFFTLSTAEARAHGLRRSDLVPISPAGSSHLRALGFTRTDHDELGARGAKAWLFRPKRLSAAAKRYIALGEAQGVHEAYKCRVRSPWWRTPLPDPPDAFFTYMNEATPQLAANPDGFHYLNSVHGLYLDDAARDLADVLPLAALSSPTGLSAEITGRAYGGGVLKMEPREAALLQVPSPDLVRARQSPLRSLLPEAKAMLASGKLDAVRALVDEVLVTEPTDVAGLGEVRDAHHALVTRRRGRAASSTTKGAA